MPFLNPVGDVFVDIMQKGKMDSVLMINIGAVTQFGRFINASTLRVAL